MSPALPDLDTWRTGGERVLLGDHHLFVRQAGKGRHLTLLHGFPTCSWDWSRIWDALAAERELLAVDLLGFGDSDKPSMRYTFADQADRLQRLWTQRGVTKTTLVAHDYSATLALELLARRIDGDASLPELEGVILLNGGLRGSLHRPRPIQRLLKSPIGPLVARLMNRKKFGASMKRVFVTPPTEADLDTFWASIETRRGTLRTPQLLKYIDDRTTFADRWEGALEHTDVPVTFIWGTEDPVSGEHVLASVDHLGTAHRLPVGHWPQWEDPEAVARLVLEASQG